MDWRLGACRRVHEVNTVIFLFFSRHSSNHVFVFFFVFCIQGGRTRERARHTRDAPPPNTVCLAPPRRVRMMQDSLIRASPPQHADTYETNRPFLPPRAVASLPLSLCRKSTQKKTTTQAYWMEESYLHTCFAHLGAFFYNMCSLCMRFSLMNKETRHDPALFPPIPGVSLCALFPLNNPQMYPAAAGVCSPYSRHVYVLVQHPTLTLLGSFPTNQLFFFSPRFHLLRLPSLLSPWRPTHAHGSH